MTEMFILSGTSLLSPPPAQLAPLHQEYIQRVHTDHASQDLATDLTNPFALFQNCPLTTYPRIPRFSRPKPASYITNNSNPLAEDTGHPPHP